MKLHTSRKWLAAPAVVLGSLVASACGGTIEFQDKSALTIEGEGPPKPVAKKKRVTVKADKIEIDEKIMFAKAAAEIMSESHGLLDEIVEVIQENKDITKISVEGYTSSEGSADFNRKLSDDRSKAVVKYLTDHGVDAKRLQAKGFGPDKPLAPNDTEDNREKNRRVEFNIVAQKKAK